MAWSDLPADLLRCISSHLPVVDYLRLTFVCTSWNSALALNGGRPHLLRTRCRPSLWLLFPGNVEVASHRLNFWDPTVEEGSRGFHRRVPSLSRHISDRRCIGSKDGWLVTLGKRDLQPRLFNPLTKSEILLPCLYSNILENYWVEIKREYAPNGSVEYFIDQNFELHGRKFCLDNYFHKIVLSSKDPSGTAVVIYGGYRKLALARPEDQSWFLLLDLPRYQEKWTTGFVDVCYHEEEQRFYAITFFSAVVSFDINGQNVTFIRSSLKEMHMCQYIAFLSGTLLRIVRNTSRARAEHTGGDYIEKTDNIIVFKLKLLCTRVVLGSIRSSPKWILVSDLGGHSLFIGYNQTFSLHHTRVPGIKPNCIYFSEYRWYFTLIMYDIPDAGLFDLHNHSIKYFLRSDSYPKFPPSIWFTPSLS